jgi:hypothetical protein
MVAALLSLVGVFVDRLTFVEAGQQAPVTTVSGVVSAPFAAYSPSPVEIAIVVGGIALVAFVYTLAERYLDLSESEAHTMIWLPAWALAGFATATGASRRAARALPRFHRPRRRPAIAGDEQTETDAPSAAH